MKLLFLFCVLFNFLIKVVFWDRCFNALIVIKHVFSDVDQEIRWGIWFNFFFDKSSNRLIKNSFFGFLTCELKNFFGIWFSTDAIVETNPLRLLTISGNIGKNKIMPIVWGSSFMDDYWIKGVVTIWIVLVVSRSSNDKTKIQGIAIFNRTEDFWEPHFLFVPFVPFEIYK